MISSFSQFPYNQAGCNPTKCIDLYIATCEGDKIYTNQQDQLQSISQSIHNLTLNITVESTPPYRGK
ncbi:hypothetical protein FGO68_gene10936 [Halteria grandinella]|uniref:Uncharacterized protein n=1 Tax=Halteria grandinella TaxID=5974 RepID=A0A8J8T2W9_HALGN|nr:hypothetical protein FGO68_gene10936 [Halteria grandinella]